MRAARRGRRGGPGLAWAVAASALCAGAGACGGATVGEGADAGAADGGAAGGGGSAMIGGTVGGGAVAVVDVVGIASSDVESGKTVSYAGVIVANQSGTCATLQRDGNPPGAQALDVLVATDGAAVAPGTYALGPGPTNGAWTSVTYVAQDAACHKTTSEQAQTGSITLTAVSSALVTGRFDVTFPSGDHLTGTFSAPVCAVDIGALANETPLPCGQ